MPTVPRCRKKKARRSMTRLGLARKSNPICCLKVGVDVAGHACFFKQDWRNVFPSLSFFHSFVVQLVRVSSRALLSVRAKKVPLSEGVLVSWVCFAALLVFCLFFLPCLFCFVFCSFLPLSFLSPVALCGSLVPRPAPLCPAVSFLVAELTWVCSLMKITDFFSSFFFRFACVGYFVLWYDSFALCPAFFTWKFPKV
jgi:hypothetical protein